MSKSYYGFPVPPNYFDTTNVQISGEKNVNVGIRTTPTLVITCVMANGLAHTKLHIGDVILSVNGQKVESRDEFNKCCHAIVSKGAYSMDIVITRPLVSLPIKPAMIPRGYDVVAGCRYHVGVLYRLPLGKLSLSIKAYMCKVFVSKTEDGTLAGLTLKIGDSILDVDGQPVSTVQDTSELLITGLRNKGYVEMVIEQPVEVVNKNIVRQALIADKTAEVVIPKDVYLICRNELKRFESNPNLAPNKHIIKEKDKGETSKRETGHVTVSDKSEDVPIACDGNPNLLMPVPIPNFQIQQSQQGSAPAAAPPGK